MIGREVITLILSAAVAAVVVALAVRMLPGAGQLAYGNPMPVFKVAYSNGAVQLRVEDFAGVPYQRAYFYVDGRYVGSEPPGGRITVKCGDRVAALVQYASGVKEVSGTVMCARPAKAPSGGLMPQNLLFVDRYAYASITGSMEATGAPVVFDGGCSFSQDDYGNYYISSISLKIDAVSPVALISWKDEYTRNLMLSWSPPSGAEGELECPNGVCTQMVPIDVLVPPKAPLSQLLGGAHLRLNVTTQWGFAWYGASSAELYVNGTLVAYCYVTSQTYTGTSTYSYTEYRTPNATADIESAFQVYDANGNKVAAGETDAAVWITNKGVGVDVISSPDSSMNMNIPPPSNPVLSTSAGGYEVTLGSNGVMEIKTPDGYTIRTQYSTSNVNDPQFVQTVSELASDPNALQAYVASILAGAEAQYNVPKNATTVSGSTSYYYTVHYTASKSNRLNVMLQVPLFSSFGAVFANTFLPLYIRMPQTLINDTSPGAYMASS
ncbi:MAG: hypothetical protein RXR06_11835 [Thermoproteus sp.]